MSQSISSNLNIATLNHTSSVTPRNTAKLTPDTVSTPHSTTRDGASLSLASTVLSHALKISDARTEKVASLQQAIVSGTYHVPSGDVAGKLIQSLLG